MHDKELSWIEAGIKVLARTGKLELRELCRERGKAMSSFYSIYPNYEDSRGLDRYMIDLLQHHKKILDVFMEQIDKVIIDNDMPEVIEKIYLKIWEFNDYNACSARIRHLAEAKDDQLFISYWEEINPLYKNKIKLFYKINNIPEDLILDEHELRLGFDGLLMFDNKKFIQDGINTAITRLKTKDMKK